MFYSDFWVVSSNPTPVLMFWPLSSLCSAGESLSFADDLLSGLATSCVAAGRSHGDVPDTSLYSVIFKCLEPDGLYK